MTVGDLKEMCEDILYTLEDYDDNLKIKLSANTYRIGNDFISTYEGYLPLGDIESRIEGNEEEEDW